MKDALFFNKLAGAVLTAGILFYAAMFATEILYHPEELAENAVPIDLGEAAVAAAPVEEAPAGPDPILAMLVTADIAAGETLTRRCTSCHSFEEGGANKVGPNLWNVVAGPKGHIDGFAYSDALMAMADQPWGYAELNHFLWNPKDYMPGTKMNFAGLRSAQDRANLIAYMRSMSGSPAELPTQEEIAAEVTQ
jgi:cytochrome c